MPRYGGGLPSDWISAQGGTQNCLQHQGGPMGVPKASLWVKNGPCYFSKNDELDIECANWHTLFCFLDNIIIYARSLADHNTKLWEMLHRLWTYRLKLQPDNWEYTWYGNYCKCVQPAQLPVLTWGSSSVPPGTTSTIRSPPGYNNAAKTNSRW
jgi:hypothetical protein